MIRQGLEQGRSVSPKSPIVFACVELGPTHPLRFALAALGDFDSHCARPLVVLHCCLASIPFLASPPAPPLADFFRRQDHKRV